MADVEPGKTYLGITCRQCGKLSPFVEFEPGTTLGQTGGEFEIECVRCGHEAVYQANELRKMKVHRKH